MHASVCGNEDTLHEGVFRREGDLSFSGEIEIERLTRGSTDVLKSHRHCTPVVLHLHLLAMGFARSSQCFVSPTPAFRGQYGLRHPAVASLRSMSIHSRNVVLTVAGIRIHMRPASLYPHAVRIFARKLSKHSY